MMRSNLPTAPVREVSAQGWRVRLNRDRQVLRLEMPEYDWRAHDRRAAELAPVLPRAEGGPLSAATLLLKAKQFDDRLYATVELAAQRGLGRFAGKAALLRTLAATLAAGPSGAAAIIHTACDLGGVAVELPAAAREGVRKARAAFLTNELLAKPLGFYTWTAELSAIFRQDRFLHQPLDPECANELAQALEQTAGATEAHRACLRLNARLTNPAQKLGVRDSGKRPPFFPPSRSHEVALFESLYDDQHIPADFDLMNELIVRVRAGDIDLTPTEASGWYDWQTWALEPLLVPGRMPENARLELGKRYRKHLEDLFRGALALARETHVKQMRSGGGGYGGPRQRPIYVNPSLTIEPLPMLYARRAAGYAFVRSVLEEAFGTEALAGMARFTPDGGTAGGLAEELAWMEELFTGAAATASAELGMRPADGAEAAAKRLAAWRAKLAADPDVSRDVRMMVPVFHDLERRKTKVWAFLGWRTVAVDASYRVSPTVLAMEPQETQATEPPAVQFGSERYELATPVQAEVYVTRLLNRDEFRRHCDHYKTRQAILANLR